MIIENKLGIKDEAELARQEERISKQNAMRLFESGALDRLVPGSFRALAEIHKSLFGDIYEFAGAIRTVNIAKGNFRFAPVMYLKVSLENVEKMPQSTFDEIIEKLGNSNETCILLGDMAVKKALPKKAKGELPANVMVAPIHTIMPRAATVAVAGLKKLANNEIGSVMDMEPIYIRRSEAEDLWEKRQAKLKAEAEKNA